MRMTVPLILAGALVASSPALAQDTNNTATADANAVVNATDANSVAAVPTNDAAAAPAVEPTTTETATADSTQTDKKGGGFPWGVIGLLGLVGLIPRKGR